MYFQTDYASPVGKITLAGDGGHLTGLWLEGQKYFASTIKEEMHRKDSLPVFEAAKDWLDRYFSEKKTGHLRIALSPGRKRFPPGGLEAAL